LYESLIFSCQRGLSRDGERTTEPAPRPLAAAQPPRCSRPAQQPALPGIDPEDQILVAPPMRCAPDLPQLASRGSNKLKRLLWIVVRTNGSPQLVRSTQSPRPLECQLEGRRLSFRLCRRGEGRRVALDSSARGGGYQRCTCDGAKQWQRPQWLCAVNSPGSAACRAASTGNTANLYRGRPVRSFCFGIFLLRSKAGACGRTAARLAAGLFL